MTDFRPDIWRLQAKFDTQGLMDALVNDDPGIRRRAAAALRALGSVDAIPALKAALEKERDTDTRSNIVAALAALEQERGRASDEAKIDPISVSAVDELIKQLSSPQPEKMITAAIKLGEMRDKRAVEPLVLLFNNAKVPINVRLAIAEALLKLESAPVEVALLGALRSSNWRVRRNGAAILGQLRAEWAVEPLTKALKDEHEIVRRTARAALKYINSAEARAALGIVEHPTPKTDTLIRPPKPGTPATSPLPQPTVVSVPVLDEPQPAVPVAQPSDIDASAPTQPQRPAEKLAWPKREIPPEEDPSRMVTKPLDPKRLEEAQERLNGTKSEGGDSSS